MSKVFCVGQHKTGTGSLYILFRILGLKTDHGTNWSRQPIPSPQHDRFDAFSDGGGHFWDPDQPFGGNHQIAALREAYPDSRFILQVRDLEPWVVSKMVHAGWRAQTQIVEPSGALNHDNWGEKSLEAIQGWIVNRSKYYAAAIDYLAQFPDEVLVIDIINDKDLIGPVSTLVTGRTDLRTVPKITRFHRLANRVSPRYIPDSIPRENVNARKADPADRVRLQEIARSVIASMPAEYLDTPDSIKRQWAEAVAQRSATAG